MDYYHIKRNEEGVYYVREKNFGYKPDAPDDESSSHWTWHITQRGVEHLCRDVLGRPQPMPRAITYEQLVYLKDLNMLSRSDGTPIGSIRPEKQPSPKTKRHAKTGKKIRELPIQQISRPKPVAPVQTPVTPQPPTKLVPEPPSGLWNRLKAWLGLKSKK